jgi:hypothetical protein
MRVCGKKFKFFDCIDLKIIAFEGRRRCFFVLSLGDFDSWWRQKLEFHKVEVFEV